jgi:hypothetical protein
MFTTCERHVIATQHPPEFSGGCEILKYMLYIEELQARISKAMATSNMQVPQMFVASDPDNALVIHRDTRAKVLTVLGRHMQPLLCTTDEIVTEKLQLDSSSHFPVSIALETVYNQAATDATADSEYNRLVKALNAEAEVVHTLYKKEYTQDGISLLHDIVRHGVRTIVALQAAVATTGKKYARIGNIGTHMLTAPNRFMTAIMHTSGGQAIAIEQELGWYIKSVQDEPYGVFHPDAFELRKDNGIHLDISCDMLDHLSTIDRRRNVRGCVAHEILMGTATTKKKKIPSWIQAMSAESHRLLTKFWLPNLQK